MSSRARRMPATAEAVTFEWGRSAGAAPVADDRVRPLAQVHAQSHGQMVRRAGGAADAEAPEARLAAIERDAFATGYEQGERAGMQAAAEQGEAMLRRLAQSLEELTTLRAEMIRATERQMVDLSLAVARRIVHREVSLDADLLIAMARVALDRLADSPQVTVRLHPADYEAAGASRLASLGAVVVVNPDPAVVRGGCLVESEFGTLDAGVDAQLQELARALLGDGTLAGEHAPA